VTACARDTRCQRGWRQPHRSVRPLLCTEIVRKRGPHERGGVGQSAQRPEPVGGWVDAPCSTVRRIPVGNAYLHGLRSGLIPMQSTKTNLWSATIGRRLDFREYHLPIRARGSDCPFIRSTIRRCIGTYSAHGNGWVVGRWCEGDCCRSRHRFSRRPRLLMNQLYLDIFLLLLLLLLLLLVREECATVRALACSPPSLSSIAFVGSSSLSSRL
jgi:hypothetical protein